MTTARTPRNLTDAALVNDALKEVARAAWRLNPVPGEREIAIDPDGSARWTQQAVIVGFGSVLLSISVDVPTAGRKAYMADLLFACHEFIANAVEVAEELWEDLK